MKIPIKPKQTNPKPNPIPHGENIDMAANRAIPTPAPALAPEPDPYPPAPQFSASGCPNTRADRIAFQVWVIMFLLVIIFTLMNYLLGRML